MQLVVLAYVSTGSFISHTADPCLIDPGQSNGAGEPKAGGLNCRAAMPKEHENMTIMYRPGKMKDVKFPASVNL